MAPLDRTAQPSAAPEMVLRAARPEDIPAIDAMHALSVQALAAADYTPAEVELFLAHLGTYDPAVIEHGTYFVLEHEGRVVASGGWSDRLPPARIAQVAVAQVAVAQAAEQPAGAGSPPRAPFSLSPHSAKIRSVFVHPQYARLGLGARLVRHAEGEAVAAGHHLIELWSTPTGMPFYRRLGYQALAPLAIPCRNGAGLPAIHMAKLVGALDATAA